MVLIRKPSPTSGCAVGKRNGVIVMGNSSNFNVKIIDREKIKSNSNKWSSNGLKSITLILLCSILS